MTVNALNSATDPDGDPLSVTGVSAPAKGAANVSGPQITYTPAAGAYGTDSFTYTVADGRGGAASNAMTVTIGNPPAPTVANISLTAPYGGSATASLAGSGVISSYAAAAPAHGSAAVSGAQVTYTPAGGYTGSDSFTYTATGPGGTSAPATAAVTVSPPAPPTVANVALTTAYNAPVSTTLSGSGVISSYAVSSPSHGSTAVSGSTLTYTPAAGYVGADAFTYTAAGPGGVSPPANVSVTVAPPPAPSVSNVSLSTTYGAADSVNLAGTGVIFSYAVGTPGHGSAAVSGSTATYTPSAGFSGADSFAYTATGPGGTSPAATVSVTVAAPPNGPPTANNDVLFALPPGSSGSVRPTGSINPLANDSDPDHDTLAIVSITQPAGGTGTATFTANSITYTYGQSILQNSTTLFIVDSDSLSYTISDGHGHTATATVGITVKAYVKPN